VALPFNLQFIENGGEMFAHVGNGRWRARLFVGLWLVLALGIGACTTVTIPQPMLTGDAIRVEGALARVAAEGHNSAVYLTIVNPTGQADRLLSAETDVARVVELHETLEQDGIMRMQPRPEGFEIPARARTELVPGGKHIMLVDLNQALAEDDTITVTLHLEGAGAIQVTASVTGDIRGASHEH
jgi:periplasmic copper chaperone A